MPTPVISQQTMPFTINIPKVDLKRFKGLATGITDVIIEVDAPAYNLAGQRVTDTTKGIIVKSGKKYIRK